MNPEYFLTQPYNISLPSVANAADFNYAQSKVIPVNNHRMDKDQTHLEIEVDNWHVIFSSLIYLASHSMKLRAENYERRTKTKLKRTDKQKQENNPNDPELLICFMKEMIRKKEFRNRDLTFLEKVMDEVLECRRDITHEEDVPLIPNCDRYLEAFIELAKPAFLDVPLLLQKANDMKCLLK